MGRILYPIKAEPVLTEAQRPEATANEARWHQGFTNPPAFLRRVLPVAVVATTVVAQPPQVPNPVPVPFVSSWTQPLSEPVRFRRFPTAEQQSLAWSGFTPARTDIPWFEPLSEPVRLKPRAREFPALSWSGFTPAAGETVTVDKWFEPLSDPTRRKKPQPEVGFWFAYGSYPGTGDVLYSSVNTTVTFSKALLYQSIGEPVQFTTGETITVDKWFMPLAEPTRRRGFPSYLQDENGQTLFTPAETDVRWFVPLSEPVRKRPRATEFPALAWSTFTPEPATFDDIRWFGQLSEPVRYRLSVVYQRDFFFDPYPIPDVVPPVVVTPPTPPTEGGQGVWREIKKRDHRAIAGLTRALAREYERTERLAGRWIIQEEEEPPEAVALQSPDGLAAEIAASIAKLPYLAPHRQEIFDGVLAEALRRQKEQIEQLIEEEKLRQQNAAAFMLMFS